MKRIPIILTAIMTSMVFAVDNDNEDQPIFTMNSLIGLTV